MFSKVKTNTFLNMSTQSRMLLMRLPFKLATSFFALVNDTDKARRHQAASTQGKESRVRRTGGHAQARSHRHRYLPRLARFDFGMVTWCVPVLHPTSQCRRAREWHKMSRHNTAWVRYARHVCANNVAQYHKRDCYVR